MFNDKQIEAINSLEGRVRVIAGAGSGKTKTLVERYVKLIEKGINPDNILCVTFTNKAADEMKSRIKKLTDTKDLPYICTFHSFCLRLLREYSYILGYPSNFSVLDGDDQTVILKDVFKECYIDKEELSYKTAKDIISNIKITKELYLLNVFKSDETIKNLYKAAKEDYIGLHIDEKETLANAVYFGYLYYQQKATGIDFNDMIILTCIILKERPDILAKLQKQFKYVMVDEYQDVSFRQNELVEMLTEKSGNLFVVGDPDQTIYSWRGAKPEILVDFDKGKKTKTIIMNQNYRSTPNILDVANTIIEKNTLRVEKDLFTENESGEKVYHGHFNYPNEEAVWICNEIKTLLKKYKPKDIVILYRMHFLSRAVEEQLIKNKIPYTIHSGTNFYERKEIKDVLAYLKVIVNPNDDISLRRIINVPTRGIGYKTIDELKKCSEIRNCSMWEACNHFIKTSKNTKIQDFVMLINLLLTKKDLPIRELTEFVLDKSGYSDLLRNSLEPERKENIQELLESMKEYKNLESYLQEVALLTNTDKKTKNTVTLMTIHSAKGLEWPVVFVIGMSEGQFPSAYAETNRAEEEERRLAYVAYTRAKEKLYVTDSSGCDFKGNERHTSRFIQEIPKELLKTNKKESFSGWRPKAFVVKHRVEEEDRITDATLYNPTCDIGTCIASKAARDVRDYYGSGKCHGQYFQNGQYYDWDDDTYLQGSIDAEDIFDEDDFC